MTDTFCFSLSLSRADSEVVLIRPQIIAQTLAVIVERYRNEQQTKGKTIVVGATLGIGIVFANRTQGKKITN